jgi:tRNA(Arg) A34 adenosine deaminase TadA
MNDESFMNRAIEISRTALGIAGAAPFGAVVVRDGIIVGEGLNHAAARFDPSSHGEVEAVKDACRNLQTLDLSGCDLYTSCEPCAMCVATMRIAGIRTLIYAASLAEAAPAIATAMKPTIDTEDLRSEAGLPVEARRMPSRQICADDAVEVLRAWAAAAAR